MEFPNFYSDPESIRQHAASVHYDRFGHGYYIGCDSYNKMTITEECETKIKSIFKEHYGIDVKVAYAVYRIANEDDFGLSYVHTDYDRKQKSKGWHVLIPLWDHTKNQDSLVLYEHVIYGTVPPFATSTLTSKEINDISDRIYKETHDLTQFRSIREVPYKYNKAVIIDYAHFHSPLRKTGFGKGVLDGRLIHLIDVHQI
jgi:hypothetical protein